MTNKPRRANLKPPGKCIFCGGTPMSKEHIWSDWLEEVLPRQDHRFESFSSRFYKDGSLIQKSDTPDDRKTGAVYTKKSRKVCVKCNNTWMSKIVDLAKPYAIDLITGRSIILDKEAQLRLSIWLSLTIIFANQQSKMEHKLSKHIFQFIYKNHTPPSDWHIEIGTNKTNFGVQFSNNYLATKPDEGTTVDEKIVFHSMTMTIGHLYATVYFADPITHALAGIMPTNLHFPTLLPIWPIREAFEFIYPGQYLITGRLVYGGGFSIELALRMQRYMAATFRVPPSR